MRGSNHCRRRKSGYELNRQKRKSELGNHVPLAITLTKKTDQNSLLMQKSLPHYYNSSATPRLSMSWTGFLPAEHAERRRFFPRVQRVLRAEFHCALLPREVAAGSGEKSSSLEVRSSY